MKEECGRREEVRDAIDGRKSYRGMYVYKATRKVEGNEDSIDNDEWMLSATLFGPISC